MLSRIYGVIEKSVHKVWEIIHDTKRSKTCPMNIWRKYVVLLILAAKAAGI